MQKTDDTPLDINQLQSLIIVLLLLIVAILVGQIWKNHQNSRDRMQCIAQSFHILSHRFRDEMFQILWEHENNELSSTLLYRHLFDFLERSLTALCNIMSDFTGKEIYACIQMIDCPSNGQTNNDEVLVFCRSENSDERRKDQDRKRRTHLLKDDPILSQMVGHHAIPFFHVLICRIM